MNSHFRHPHATGPDSDSTDGLQSGPDQTDPTWVAGPDVNDGALVFGVSGPGGNLQTVTIGSGSAAEVVTYGSPTGLTINVTYDSSVTGLATSNPTLYAEYLGAVQQAVAFYQNEITNQVTISITFGYGQVDGQTIGGGSIGESISFYNVYSYSTFYNAVKNTLDSPSASAVEKAAFATLPTTDPTGGNGMFRVYTAGQKVLGLSSYSGTDGYVGINSSVSYGWTQPNTSGSGFDAVATLEHEISEVLGRADALGGIDPFDATKKDYTLLDFFHYAAAGGASNAAPGSAAGVLNEPFVAGYNASLQSYFSYNGTTITLPYDTPSQVAAGDDVADWTNSVMNDSYGFAFPGATERVSNTDLQELNVLGYELACFLPGTRIATPAGEICVEDLAVGDLISNARGEPVPIAWIGYGKGLATRGHRSEATPVIVRKGALADNVPNRELHITKGHSLYIDGVLIPAEFLVNHRSILWDDNAREVEFYHIELPAHDVLLANGTPAESYREDGNRWMFLNADSGKDQPEKALFAPVLTGGPVVDAIWKRILDRSGPRPGLPLTDDADLHLIADGRRIDGRQEANGMHVFRLPARPIELRIVSRAGAQDELGLARDPRGLGVALRKIVVWQGRHVTLTGADDPRLCDGFHAYESDGDLRWTDGDAALPVSILGEREGALDLEIQVVSTTHYPLFAEQSRDAA